MTIYTRKGDTGTTSLYGGVRVDKDSPHMEVCGNIDELSAWLGFVRTEEGLPIPFGNIMLRIQQELIGFCSDIVSDSKTIMPEHVRQMESEIDRIESELPVLTQFVISGTNRCSAMLHIVRTVCRRAERSLFTLCRTENKLPHLMVYLNRLSDLLFVMARKAGESTTKPIVPPPASADYRCRYCPERFGQTPPPDSPIPMSIPATPYDHHPTK